MSSSIAFGNVVQTLQSDIINILKADTTSLTITYPDDTTSTTTLSSLKIVDGMPSNLLKGTGFPYIIVHTPTERMFKKTLEKYQANLEIQIEVYDRREGNVRILIDAIREAVRSGRSTWQADYLYFAPMTGEIRSSTPTASYLPSDQTKPVWYMSLFLSFKWSGLDADC